MPSPTELSSATTPELELAAPKPAASRLPPRNAENLSRSLPARPREDVTRSECALNLATRTDAPSAESMAQRDAATRALASARLSKKNTHFFFKKNIIIIQPPLLYYFIFLKPNAKN
jgi:hypothetical protein